MSKTAFQHAASELGGQLTIVGALAVMLAGPISLFADLWHRIVTVCVVLLCVGFAFVFLGTWVWNFHGASKSHIGERESDHLDTQR